ncbi:MAG: hypothetical protein M3355_00110 [Actinomycetota bacterium]|nr:hypothetical protein [Actinomycetota bacterium]
MAARRLIAILLVMLFLSSLAAALAPVQQGVEKGASSQTSTTESTSNAPTLPESAANEPQLIRQSVDASKARPPLIRADLGDQLQLRVTSRRSGTVELVDVGPTEDVGPNQPAFFDVLLRREGTFPVRFLDTDREVATIKVSLTPADAPPR